MHVSTLVRRSAALLAVLAAVSACSDAPLAPRPAERPAFDIQALQPLNDRGGTPNGNSAYSTGGDENVAILTINPNVARTYSFGDNWIYFPAHSICDPATSGYGPQYWEVSCRTLTQPLKVTVRWSSKGGHAYARFTPELRFEPADARNVLRWVILSLHDQRRLRQDDLYNILYNGTGSDGWVDESLTDPTLKVWIDPLHNSVVRRVKHFSGYMVAAGFDGRGGMDYAAY
jgi:hypothetical protein